VLADPEAELVELRPRRELAVDEEIRGLEERRNRHGHQLFDRDAAVAQDAGLAVDERDRRLARPRVDEAVVERDRARLGPQLRDVDPALTLRAHDHGQLGLLRADPEYGGRLVHFGVPPGSTHQSTRRAGSTVLRGRLAYGVAVAVAERDL